jgi:hypothetical protein
MALTMEDLRKLVEAEKLHYSLATDQPALMLGVTGLNGRYQLMISLDAEGQFLQFRTVGYRYCAADHSHLPETLKILGQLNYDLRLVKFGWDSSNGEIVVYADTWIVGGKVTQEEFQRLIHRYFSAIDMDYSRIDKTIETGKDPGPVDLMALVERGMGSGLSAGMQKLLEELLKRGKKPGAEDKKEDEKKDEKPFEPVEKI